MIEIYGKELCPYCDRAKQLCEKDGYEFTYQSLGTDFTRDELLEMFPTAKTFPQIKIDGEAIGGYDELWKWSLNQKVL